MPNKPLGGPAIVYTTRVRDAEAIFERLVGERGYERVALCTGSTGDVERRRIVEEWSVDGIDLMVATSAFGLGIDKGDVRAGRAIPVGGPRRPRGPRAVAGGVSIRPSHRSAESVHALSP